MKTLHSGTIHQAVWTHLYDDHAVRKQFRITDPLLAEPGFENGKENDARDIALKKHRPFGHRLLHEKTSFEWVQLEPSDFLTAWTVWGASFSEVALAYQLLDIGAISTWRDKDARDAARVKTMRKSVAAVPQAGSFDQALLFDGSELSYSFSRTIWADQDGRMTVIDGTHRTLAVTWALLCEGLPFPYLQAMLVK